MAAARTQSNNVKTHGGDNGADRKDAVTTPGGTTIAALGVLESSGIRGALMDAVRAAADHAKEMG